MQLNLNLKYFVGLLLVLLCSSFAVAYPQGPGCGPPPSGTPPPGPRPSGPPPGGRCGPPPSTTAASTG